MKRLKITMFLLILFLTACSSVPVRDGLYDFGAFLVDGRRMDLSQIIESVGEINTETRFKSENGEIIRHENHGTGLVLPGNLVFTAAHVVMVDKFTQNVFTPIGIATVVISDQRVDSESFLVEPDGNRIPLTPLLISSADDVAILSMPFQTEKIRVFPYGLGNSDDLRIGNMVYVVGRPMNQEANVREGIVSGLKGNALTREIYENPDNLFMFTSGLVSGDSGSPIIAMRDGKYEIVGIAQGVISTESQFGWGIRINRVKELMRSLKMHSAKRHS
ncbi:MAG: trypsin-like peptidase domain-containing protein [Deltaproteobacteria bacterium]|nr:trypsin-like peptidase domain-containing protein [Deltaproteobacteria bacterium]